ncbi:hypothetical protein ACIPPQ_04920 [Sphingopyxis sp. LARHCG72]
MTGGGFRDVPASLSIGRLTITAASRIEARRLADALPDAIARAVERERGGAADTSLRAAPVDHVTAEILRAIAPRLERER